MSTSEEKKHFRSQQPLYKIWSEMWSRCTKASHPKFKDYGGRGITVCARWRSYENFTADMPPRPSRLHSLDRRNNGRGYSPSNCRWATVAEQNRNKRSNIKITYRGKTLVMADWARKLKINKGTLRHRIVVLKLPPSKAFVKPELNRSLRNYR